MAQTTLSLLACIARFEHEASRKLTRTEIALVLLGLRQGGRQHVRHELQLHFGPPA